MAIHPKIAPAFSGYRPSMAITPNIQPLFMKIKLIVGLGNPGQEYHRTRHNAGFDYVDELARRYNGQFKADKKYFGEITKVSIGSEQVYLLKPMTFMNRSGQGIAALANFFKIKPEEILVAHDELDLSPGVSRLKIGGGHGGHNGLRDTIAKLANNRNFKRLRIGIGHPGSAPQVSGYVLSKASQADQQLIDQSIDDAVDHTETAVSGEWDKAMKDLHTKK